MSIAGKTAAVVEWLKTYPDFDGYLALNGVEGEPGAHAVNTVYNDSEVREFIDGTKEREYSFSLVMIRNWSGGVDSVNQEAEEWGERWLDWVNAQYQAGNVPDFGEKCDVREIQAVQNVPGLAEVYDEGIAKYLFQAKITYWERI